jgi:hypothetical protein
MNHAFGKRHAPRISPKAWSIRRLEENVAMRKIAASEAEVGARILGEVLPLQDHAA